MDPWLAARASEIPVIARTDADTTLYLPLAAIVFVSYAKGGGGVTQHLPFARPT